MADAFHFQLTADDQASASILRIEEAVRDLNPLLGKTREGLALGGKDTREHLDGLGRQFDVLARNARSGVQFIGDLVPPLKMVGGLTLGLSGIAAGVHAVKNNLTDFADTGYRISMLTQKVSMTADAFQELTGALMENGASREAAESAITGLFDKANDAVHGRNESFLALLQQKGTGISKTREGLADIVLLMRDINRIMQTLSPGEQALFIQKSGLSPELLSFLQQTTHQIQRLKDQARRDGLIFSDKDLENAATFKNQLNQTSAAFEGLLMKGRAWLGQSETVKATADQISQVMTYGFDRAAVGSILTFNRGGRQADMLRQAAGDGKFRQTLSWKEKLDLNLGYASAPLLKKLNAYYTPLRRTAQPEEDINRRYVPTATADRHVRQTSVPYEERSITSRGLRNNNPGNVSQAPHAAGYDGRFPVFARAADGNAAMARQLMLYGDRGIDTLNGIIRRWAPGRENNTQAYTNAVSALTGFHPSTHLDLHSPAILQTLIPAMIKHENGSQPFSREEIGQAINDAVNDPRWSGKRDRHRLFSQRQSGEFSGRTQQDRKNVSPLPLSSLFTPSAQGDRDISQLTDAITASIAKAMNTSKFELEISLLNQQTGEHRKVQTDGRGRVSLSMESAG